MVMYIGNKRKDGKRLIRFRFNNGVAINKIMSDAETLEYIENQKLRHCGNNEYTNE